MLDWGGFFGRTLVQVVIDVAGIGFEGILAQGEFAFRNKLFGRSEAAFLVIVSNVLGLAIELILWEDKVLVDHLVFALRPVPLVARIVCGVGTVVFAVLDGVGAMVPS